MKLHNVFRRWGRSPRRDGRPASGDYLPGVRVSYARENGYCRVDNGAMSHAGQRLVKLLDEGLPNGIIWKASERATLGLISDTADMVETLKGLLAAEVASLDRSTHGCAELAGEIRQAQASIAKMIASLDPEMVTVAKSVRHQNAV
jgi:hypothetical protein